MFLGVAAAAGPVAAPAASVAAPAPIFHPFAVSGSSELPVSSLAPCPTPFAAPGVVPDFASAAPPLLPQPPVSAAPLASAYVGSAEDHFDPGYLDAVPRDPEVPLPQSFPDSIQVELRRMYTFLVDLFPQAVGAPSVEPPPLALFKLFFTPASSPQQPIFLNWFARVRSTLEETDTCLASCLWQSGFCLLGRHSMRFRVSLPRVQLLR